MDRTYEQETALVEGCRRKDPGAWETVVNCHGKQIFRLCYRFTGRRDEAEDLTQEVFLRVYQNISAFNAEAGRFRSWILRVGRNLAIDHHRQHRRFPAADVLDDHASELEDKKAEDPYCMLQRSEDSNRMMRRLASLPPEVKEAITLHKLHELSYDEISSRLGVPVGTVKSRVSRGRARLGSPFRIAQNKRLRVV